jgi:hypothetical protein
MAEMDGRRSKRFDLADRLDSSSAEITVVINVGSTCHLVSELRRAPHNLGAENNA